MEDIVGSVAFGVQIAKWMGGYDFEDKMRERFLLLWSDWQPSSMSIRDEERQERTK